MRPYLAVMLVFFLSSVGAAEKPDDKARLDYCIEILESGISPGRQDTPGAAIAWIYTCAKITPEADTQRGMRSWEFMEHYLADRLKDTPNFIIAVEKGTLYWISECAIADKKVNRERVSEWRRTLMGNLDIKELDSNGRPPGRYP